MQTVPAKGTIEDVLTNKNTHPMKAPIILTLFAALTTAASPDPSVALNRCEHIAKQVIAAFRQTSPVAYVALFPSLAEFHDLMDANAHVYGNVGCGQGGIFLSV